MPDLQVLAELLGDEERPPLPRRLDGDEWAAIAEDEGCGAEALRKRLTRAVDRVAREIGLDGSDDG